MVKGVGTDIVEIERIKNARKSFFKSVYTDREMSKLHGNRYNSLAGMFAAKEAVAKALGTGFMGFVPRDIEIVQDEMGKPFCFLNNGAQKRLDEIGATKVFISISHSKENAVALAVIE